MVCSSTHGLPDPHLLHMGVFYVALLLFTWSTYVRWGFVHWWTCRSPSICKQAMVNMWLKVNFSPFCTTNQGNDEYCWFSMVLCCSFWNSLKGSRKNTVIGECGDFIFKQIQLTRVLKLNFQLPVMIRYKHLFFKSWNNINILYSLMFKHGNDVFLFVQKGFSFKWNLP